jgi:hypothetical protein
VGESMCTSSHLVDLSEGAWDVSTPYPASLHHPSLDAQPLL